MNHTQNKQSNFFLNIHPRAFFPVCVARVPSLVLSSLSSSLLSPSRDSRWLAAGQLLATHHSSHQSCHWCPQLSPDALTSQRSVLHPLFCISSPARPHCRQTLPAFCSLSSPATHRRHFRVSMTFKCHRRSPGATSATTMSSKPLNCPDQSSLLCCSTKDHYCRPPAIRRH